MATLTTYHSKFLEDLKKRKKSHSTLLAYGKDVEQFIELATETGNTEPEQITAELVLSFSNALKDKKYTSKSIVRKLNSVKAFFGFLVDQQAITKNPVEKIEKPNLDNTLPRILSKIEYRALRDACREDRRISAVVELLLQTGVRISELAKLTLDDLSLDTESPQIKIQDQETHTIRTMPLNNAAIRAMREYLAIRPKTNSKWVFLTKNCKQFLVRNIRAAIDRYFRVAGIEGAKVNDLRHTFIVRQLEAGLPLLYVSKLVGHKRLTTTEQYLQLLQSSFDSSKMRIEEL